VTGYQNLIFPSSKKLGKYLETEGSSLLACETAPLGKWFPVFHGNVSHLF